MASHNRQLLGAEDPPPYTLIEKPGNIIFTGPHNGLAVPDSLPACLGVDPSWFQSAHEASDLHVAALFEAFDKTLEEVSLLYGNYSRLVCDLNAMPDYAITRQSPENKNIVFAYNQPEKCCSQQRLARIEQVYWPYHDAKKELIDQKRKQHQGVIVLDIHSFTPTWDQKQRDVEIGTIRCEKTPLSYATEEFLKKQKHFKFVSGEPYRVAERPSNAAPLISRYNDLQYLGLEIRNDLLETADGLNNMADFLKMLLNHIRTHPNQDNILALRSDVDTQKTKKGRPEQPDGYDSWSI